MMQSFDAWWDDLVKRNDAQFSLLKARYGVEAYNEILPNLKEMARVGFEAGAHEAFNFIARARKGLSD